MRPAGRIPSLDGLRAVSIALVLFSHLAGTQHFVSQRAGSVFALGELGVTVFFVISGFLITTLLLDELAATGDISLAGFYARRTFRIVPAYYALILGTSVMASAGLVTLHPSDVSHALTYTSNYHPARAWALGHTWSLSVEEQFYLLWPAVLLVAGRRRGLAVAAAVVCLAPFVRLALWYWVPSAADGIGQRFETVADAIAIGCLLAGLLPWLTTHPLLGRFFDSRLFLLVPLAVLASNLLHDRPRLFFVIGMPVTNLGIALGMLWCIRHANGRLGRLLNSPPLVSIGTLSYSLYLWQQMFLDRTGGRLINGFPLNLLLAIAAAVLSYRLIERPALRWRRLLDVRRPAPTAGAPGMA